MRSLVRTLALPLLVAGAGAKPAPAPDPQFVAQWMRSSLSSARSERLGPPVAARISADASVGRFWADNPAATGTPGFHWVSVLNQMVARRHLSADRAAEGYALMSMSIADAFIGCWKEW